MNRVVMPDPRERFKARRYKTYPNGATVATAVTITRTEGDYFKFDYANARRTTESQPITNLRAKAETISITTHWALDFATRQYVLIGRDMWIIETIYKERDQWDNSPNGSTVYTLELSKAVNPANLKV